MCPPSCSQTNFLSNVLVAPNWLDSTPRGKGYLFHSISCPPVQTKRTVPSSSMLYSQPGASPVREKEIPYLMSKVWETISVRRQLNT